MRERVLVQQGCHVTVRLGVELDARGNVKNDQNKMTNVPGVFTAGDMARGQSLVVWAIYEGREAAKGVQQFLMKKTPRKS